MNEEPNKEVHSNNVTVLVSVNAANIVLAIGLYSQSIVSYSFETAAFLNWLIFVLLAGLLLLTTRGAQLRTDKGILYARLFLIGGIVFAVIGILPALQANRGWDTAFYVARNAILAQFIISLGLSGMAMDSKYRKTIRS